MCKYSIYKPKKQDSFHNKTVIPSFKNRLKYLKNKGKEVSISLDGRIKKSQNNQYKERFALESNKILNCSCFGVFRELPSGESYKIGQNLCKSRLCTVCRRVLSLKRKKAVLSYFNDNSALFSKYMPFMLTLTVRHNKDYRNYNYSKEILEAFKWLRSGNHANRKWWNNNIFGGFYSVEITQRNDSPHIHIHVLLLSEFTIDGNDFLKELKKKWKYKTGDSKHVDLRRGYYTERNGGTKTKHIFKCGDSIDKLNKILSETCKYTLKLDLKNLGNINDNVLNSVLVDRRRMFGFFGNLYGKGITNLSLNELSEVEVSKKEIVSIFTGEIFNVSDTKMKLTHFNNTIEKCFESILYYEFIDNSKVINVNEPKEACIKLAQKSKCILKENEQQIKPAFWVVEKSP